MKTCNKCGESKSLNSFYTKNKKGDPMRYAPTCKGCELKHRQKQYNGLSVITRKKVGMSESEFLELVEQSDSKCNICFRQLDVTKSTEYNKRICLDHCHTTNKARGILCNSCNTALGLVKEDISNLENMIRYIERHK